MVPLQENYVLYAFSCMYFAYVFVHLMKEFNKQVPGFNLNMEILNFILRITIIYLTLLLSFMNQVTEIRTKGPSFYRKTAYYVIRRHQGHYD